VCPEHLRIIAHALSLLFLLAPFILTGGRVEAVYILITGSSGMSQTRYDLSFASPILLVTPLYTKGFHCLVLWIHKL